MTGATGPTGVTGASGPTGPTGFTGSVNVLVGTASIVFTTLNTSTTTPATYNTTLLTSARPMYWLTGYRLQSGGPASLSYIYLANEPSTSTITIYAGAIALAPTSPNATFLVYYTYSS